MDKISNPVRLPNSSFSVLIHIIKALSILIYSFSLIIEPWCSKKFSFIFQNPSFRASIVSLASGFIAILRVENEFLIFFFARFPSFVLFFLIKGNMKFIPMCRTDWFSIHLGPYSLHFSFLEITLAISDVHVITKLT